MIKGLKELIGLKEQFIKECDRLTKLGFLSPESKARKPKIKAYQILLAQDHSVKQTVKIFKEL